MFLYAHLVMSTIKMLPPEIELIRQELRAPPPKVWRKRRCQPCNKYVDIH